MTAQMDVERTEEPKQSHFKLAYGALLASLLVIWGGCYYAILVNPEVDEDLAVKGMLWTVGLVGVAVSIVFMWRGYDRNSDHWLCMKFGIAFLTLNLVGFFAFALAAIKRNEATHPDGSNPGTPIFYMFCFALLNISCCICGVVAMCAFPRPMPHVSVGYEKVPPAI